MAGTVWYNLQGGQKAKASQVNSNFDWIEGDILPMNAGSQTNGVYDFGSSSFRWRDGFFSRDLYMGFQGKLYLGDSSTYISQDATNNLSLFVNSTVSIRCFSNLVRIYPVNSNTAVFGDTYTEVFTDFVIPAARKLFFDGDFSGNTYIWEQDPNQLSVYAGGNITLRFFSTPDVRAYCNFLPNAAETRNLGNSSLWWNEVHYHTLVSHSLNNPKATNATAELKKVVDFKNKNQYPDDVYVPADTTTAGEGIGINNLLSYMLKSIQEVDDRLNNITDNIADLSDRINDLENP